MKSLRLRKWRLHQSRSSGHRSNDIETAFPFDTDHLSLAFRLMNQLNGKVALVTGASAPQGIGRAIAMRLAADGAKVVVTDRFVPTAEDTTIMRLEEIAQQIRNIWKEALALPLDVTKADQISSTVERCISDFGSLDILVNNAAPSQARQIF